MKPLRFEGSKNQPISHSNGHSLTTCLCLNTACSFVSVYSLPCRHTTIRYAAGYIRQRLNVYIIATEGRDIRRLHHPHTSFICSLICSYNASYRGKKIQQVEGKVKRENGGTTYDITKVLYGDRAVLGVCLPPFVSWGCGFESCRGHGCLSFVSCQVEIAESGWTLVQRSPTDCDVSEYDLENSRMRRPRPAFGRSATKIYIYIVRLDTNLVLNFTYTNSCTFSYNYVSVF